MQVVNTVPPTMRGTVAIRPLPDSLVSRSTAATTATHPAKVMKYGPYFCQMVMA